MFTKFASTALIALLATGALADQTVSEIDVSVDLSAIENREAAAVWTSLGTDLETAIAERVTPLLGENGTEVTVDINTVSLATAFENAYALEDSTLTGLVEISRPGMMNDEEYELSVTASQAISAMSPSVDASQLTIASEEVYRAMVDAFATNISAKLMQ